MAFQWFVYLEYMLTTNGYLLVIVSLLPHGHTLHCDFLRKIHARYLMLDYCLPVFFLHIYSIKLKILELIPMIKTLNQDFLDLHFIWYSQKPVQNIATLKFPSFSLNFCSTANVSATTAAVTHHCCTWIILLALYMLDILAIQNVFLYVIGMLHRGQQ